MRVKMSLVSVLAAAAIAVPGAVHADVYKWVDEKGGVTYGNMPPPGAKKLTQVDEDYGRVSTVPGISPELIARQRELELEARIQRLERELYDQRARDAMAAAQSYPAYPYPAYYSGYAGYPAYPIYGYGLVAARPVFPRHVRAVVPRAPVRHAAARGMRR